MSRSDPIVLTGPQNDEIKRFIALGYKELPKDQRDFECRKCWVAGGLVFQTHDWSDYDDASYHCVICNKGWISEGADS